MVLDVISNDPNHKNETFLKKYSRKKAIKNVTMVTKMLHVYISVMVPDSQNSYFLYINNERIWIWLIFRDGWRLCLEYPSSYSRQPLLGLATYSLFASLVCLFVCLSVLQFSRKRLEIRSSYFACKLHMYISRSLLILVLISQC